jgi:hypothetical protein
MWPLQAAAAMILMALNPRGYSRSTVSAFAPIVGPGRTLPHWHSAEIFAYLITLINSPRAAMHCQLDLRSS